MNEFVDLQGVSGVSYRFRLWPQGASHLPIAGNYVAVREAGEGFKVVVAGVTNDLSACRALAETSAGRGPVSIFTRLNVSRAQRTAEHEDIVGHYKPALNRAET